MSAAPLVVEVERSGLIETTHLVDVAVVDGSGTLKAWAGDAATVAYLRSSAKPVQAFVCLENGWEPPGVAQLAIACGSHTGEPAHVEAVRATLAATGVDEDELRCPVAWPLPPDVAAVSGAPARILHNCSGKHAAMLATCAGNGWPLDDYRGAGHPMQEAVLSVVKDLAERAPPHTGVDGCGVRTFAFTLAEAATILGRLDARAPSVLDAMAAHPFLVAGTGRLDTAIMEAVPGIAIKGGAEGIVCGVVRAGRMGFAIKSRDGTQRARDAATITVLRMLDALGDPLAENLVPYADPAVRGGGERVGSITVSGSLERA